MSKLNSWVGRASLVLLTMVICANASAAILQVDPNGKLTGAQNVAVGDALYDVTFKYVKQCQGCAGRFELSAINDPTTAQWAASALLNQVFIDGPAGKFGSLPVSVITPYEIGELNASNNNIYMHYFTAHNNIPMTHDSTGVVYNSGVFTSTAMMFDLVIMEVKPFEANVAVWSLSPVPEPETYAMLLAGLGVVGAIARRRKAELTA